MLFLNIIHDPPSIDVSAVSPMPKIFQVIVLGGFNNKFFFDLHLILTVNPENS